MENQPIIKLSSGKYLNLVSPEQDLMTLEVIAHGLSNTCRFAGQCITFYNVADHSTAMATYFIGRKEYKLAKEALLHDATEAFLGDVSSPLKQLLPEYQSIERNMDLHIRERYGLPKEMSKEVKDVDKMMFDQEIMMFLPSVTNHSGEPVGSIPTPSKAKFIHTYKVIEELIQREKEVKKI